ncbi:MAG TPA: hypothetical protein VIY56_17060 [Vicinamibacterales bacterium]
MKKLEVFLPRLLPWCAGAPEPLVQQALIDSAISFCEETNIVRYITDPITRIAGVADYDLELPQSTELARVIRVWWGKGPYETPSGLPLNWQITDVGQITIFPTPENSIDDPMFIEVSTTPTRSATVVADQLYSKWVEAVVGGAMYRICSQPDQPYTNLQNAALGAQAFRKGRGDAMIEATKGYVRRDTRVQMRPFA